MWFRRWSPYGIDSWLEYLKYGFLPEVVQPGFPATPSATGVGDLQPWLETALFPATLGLTSGHFGTYGRVGIALDLTATGMELPSLMTAGRWKSSRMPGQYTERQAAGRPGIAGRKVAERGIHVGGTKPVNSMLLISALTHASRIVEGVCGHWTRNQRQQHHQRVTSHTYQVST